MVNVQDLVPLTVQEDQANLLQLNMTYNSEIKDHLKKLRQIKRDLKKHPTGTPLRKRDRIDVKHTNETRTNRHTLPNDNNRRSRGKSRRKSVDEQTNKS